MAISIWNQAPVYDSLTAIEIGARLRMVHPCRAGAMSIAEAECYKEAQPVGFRVQDALFQVRER